MIAAKVASSGALDRIAAEWKMPKELAGDLVKLSLFDVILYVDDSGSMAFEEGGERIDDLKLWVGFDFVGFSRTHSQSRVPT